MTGDPNDQHALVTGAGQGIGEAIALQLLEQGARVTVLGRRAEPLQKLVEEHPGQCRMVLADVSDEKQVATAFAKAAAVQGDISILVNNAGQASSAPFMKMDAAHWQQNAGRIADTLRHHRIDTAEVSTDGDYVVELIKLFKQR